MIQQVRALYNNNFFRSPTKEKQLWESILLKVYVLKVLSPQFYLCGSHSFSSYTTPKLLPSPTQHTRIGYQEIKKKWITHVFYGFYFLLSCRISFLSGTVLHTHTHWPSELSTNTSSHDSPLNSKLILSKVTTTEDLNQFDTSVFGSGEEGQWDRNLDCFLSHGLWQQQLMEVDIDHWALQGLCSLSDPNPQQVQTWSSELCFKWGNHFLT